MLKFSIQFFKDSNEHPLDKMMKPRDKYRSLTNYWVNLILNFVLNEDDVQPGIDAYCYSYLYPYTDNIMDMKSLPKDMLETWTALSNSLEEGGSTNPNVLFHLRNSVQGGP